MWPFSKAGNVVPDNSKIVVAELRQRMTEAMATWRDLATQEHALEIAKARLSKPRYAAWAAAMGFRDALVAMGEPSETLSRDEVERTEEEREILRFASAHDRVYAWKQVNEEAEHLLRGYSRDSFPVTSGRY